MHTVRSDKVEKALLETLKKQIDIAVEMDKLISLINESGRANKNTARLMKMLTAKEREKANVEWEHFLDDTNA